MSLRVLFTYGLGGLSLIWVGIALICLINSPSPKLYIIDIFTLPLITACAIWLVMMIIGRQWPASLITATALVMLLWAHAGQAFPPRAKPAANAQPVTVMFHNMWYQNPTPEKVRDTILAEKPDIVALIEVNPAGVKALVPALNKAYPYRDVHYDRLILSRFPLRNVAYAKKLNSTHARVLTPDGHIELFVVHLTRPWPFKRGSQLMQLERLQTFMTPYNRENALLLGDFNSTPTAGLLRNYARDNDLTPAPAPIGTWPRNLPGFLRLGIDNGFVGTDLRFDKRRVGEYTGSDHLPVHFTVSRAQKPE